MIKRNFDDIMNVLMKIEKNEELSNILFVSGGIVPWLVSKKNSNRNHSDIDFLVSQENMSKIRKFLINNNLYHDSLDSLTYEESQMVDYGVSTYIQNIPIGFYPFEQMSNSVIIQRSFSPLEVNGSKDLKIKKISNMKLTDYLSQTTLPNGRIIGISSLEIIKALKEKVGRIKDLHDIIEIDKIGYNENRYKRVKESINSMESTLDDRFLENQKGFNK